MQKINFQSQGQRVEGTLFIPDNKKKNPGVIFFHGSGSSERNYLPVAEALYQKGFAVLTINFRGHANLEDLKTVTAYDGVSDGISAYDFFIQQKGVDGERIGFCGGSFGALVAVYVSQTSKIKSMLLRAPALYQEDMMRRHMAETLIKEEKIFNDMKNVGDTGMIKAISNFTGSLCVVVAEKDQLIPAWLTQAIFDSAKKAKVKEMKVMKNSLHQMMDPAQRKELLEIITKWFTENL